MPNEPMVQTVGSPDVELAAERLRRPPVRGALAAKRAVDVVLAVVMLLVLLPLLVLVGLALVRLGGGWIERPACLGRDGVPIRLLRFRALPGALERLGLRELPLLLCVLAGQMSLVGPRPRPPGNGAGHSGPRRLMAPGLIGPAQRWAADGCGAGELDDAYVAEWTLHGDLLLLLGLRARAPRHASTGLRD